MIIDRDKTNTSFTYYATAYTSQSLVSERSDYASVVGNACSKPLPEYPEENKNSLTTLTIFPNPFNPTTQVSYSLLEENYARLNIYNISGQKIAELVNQYQNAGEYKVSFGGYSLAGGILLRLTLFEQHFIT